MAKTWTFLNNPFLNAARTYKKAIKISAYTNAQLQSRQADPFFGPLFKYYNPLNQALVDAYGDWKTQGGTQKGATLTFDQLLALLSPSKIGLWDYQVMGVFAKGTPQYVAIFPNGHKPFQTGEKNQRVLAVKQLSNALNGIAALNATYDDVTKFYNQLSDAQNTKQGNMGGTGSDSKAVDDAVVAAMTGLYYVLGNCIAQFASEPTLAEPIFDLETIRDHEQVVFTGSPKGGETEAIMTHTFAAADDISLQDTGSTGISFYMSAGHDDGPAGNTLITLAAGENRKITANDFGNITHRFMHVINNDALAEGHYKVSLN